MQTSLILLILLITNFQMVTGKSYIKLPIIGMNILDREKVLSSRNTIVQLEKVHSFLTMGTKLSSKILWQTIVAIGLISTT